MAKFITEGECSHWHYLTFSSILSLEIDFKSYVNLFVEMLVTSQVTGSKSCQRELKLVLTQGTKKGSEIIWLIVILNDSLLATFASSPAQIIISLKSTQVIAESGSTLFPRCSISTLLYQIHPSLQLTILSGYLIDLFEFNWLVWQKC